MLCTVCWALCAKCLVLARALQKKKSKKKIELDSRRENVQADDSRTTGKDSEKKVVKADFLLEPREEFDPPFCCFHLQLRINLTTMVCVGPHFLQLIIERTLGAVGIYKLPCMPCVAQWVWEIWEGKCGIVGEGIDRQEGHTRTQLARFEFFFSLTLTTQKVI